MHLESASWEITVFVISWWLSHFKMLPFRLLRALETSQRLMDKVLHLHQAYVGTYLNDVAIFTKHFQQVKDMLLSIQAARVMAKPDKCHLGCTETRYLGYKLGNRKIKPLLDKIGESCSNR